MPYFWSNPQPSDATAAALAAAGGSRVDAPGISGVVAAILADRYRKQEQFQNTLAQVGKALGDYRQQQDAGAIADYLQGRGAIESLAPEARLQAVQLEQKQRDEAAKLQMEQALNDARINYYNGRAIPQPRAVPFPTGEKPMTAGQEAVQNRFDARMERADLDKQIEALNSMVKSYGFDPSILTSKTAVHSGKDKEGADVPAGMYRLDMPDSTTKDVPATDFDAAHKALDQYRALLQQRGQPEQPAASPAPAAPSNGSLIERAKQALADPEATEEEKAAARKILGQ